MNEIDQKQLYSTYNVLDPSFQIIKNPFEQEIKKQSENLPFIKEIQEFPGK